MLQKFFLICFIWLWAVPASAWRNGSAPSAVGFAQLNLGNGDIGAQTWTNLFNGAQVKYTIGTNSPAATDQYGFPVANFAGTLSGQLGASNSGALNTTGPYSFGWDAGRSCFRVVFLKAGTASNIPSGVTVTNGSGSGNLTIQKDCTSGTGKIAGSVAITWNDTTAITYQLDGAGFSNWDQNTGGRMWLARSGNSGWNGQSDETAYLAGTYWTKEFVNFIKALKPESLRPMGLNAVYNLYGQTASNVANWGYRRSVSNFSFLFSDFPLGARCGSKAGGPQVICTLSYSSGQLSATPATDTDLAAWHADEQLLGYLPSQINGITVSGAVSDSGNCQLTVSDVTNMVVGHPLYVTDIVGAAECNSTPGGQNTILAVGTSTITIDQAKSGTTYISGGGVSNQVLVVSDGVTTKSKLIVTGLGRPAYSGVSGSYRNLYSGYIAFTYDAVLDKVKVSNAGANQSGADFPIGISNSIPLEAQIQLANLVNANFWYTTPGWANNDFITNALNLICTNLNSNLNGILEWANEPWNGVQGYSSWVTQQGTVLGLTGSGNANLNMQALRTLQIMKIVLPASTCGAGRIERTYNMQNAGAPSSSNFALTGATLVSPGNAAYQAYVGGSAVNYNVAGNRPEDYLDSIAIAPYTGGGTAFSGTNGDDAIAPTSFDLTLLNAVIAATNASDPATANSLISQSVRGDYLNRTQTVTGSGTTFTTPIAHNFTVSSPSSVLRFTVVGGTGYSGLDYTKTCRVLTVPTSTTFTCGQLTNGVAGSAVNAGSSGTGTTSVGYLDIAFSDHSIFGMMNATYTQWQNFVATTLSPSPSIATKIRWYEGAIEITGPSPAQCSTLGITSPDCTTIGGSAGNNGGAIQTYWNSTNATSDIQYYYRTFMGTVSSTVTNPSGTSIMTRAKAPAHLVLSGPNLYALNGNANMALTGSNIAVPTGYYYGFQAFNLNGL